MSNQTKLYYTNPKLFEHKAKIIAIQHNNLMLDRTIFHPQGGGQPSDIGTINGISVTKVFEENENGIWHAVETISDFAVGSDVLLSIDSSARKLFSRLHSAGHLIAHVAEREFPELKAIQGHHFPNEARVEFSYSSIPDMQIFKDRLLMTIQDSIKQNQQVNTLFEDTTRMIMLGEYPATPCGGTHVQNLSEIGTILIRNVKHKDGKIRVGYDVPVEN